MSRPVATQPRQRENRPADNGTASHSSATGISTAIKTETILRRRWAYSLIRRSSSPVPAYGSRAWIELPEGSAEKIASVVVAAEAWAMDGDNLVDDLHRELDERRRTDKALDDAEYVARAEAHRRTAPKFSVRSFADRRAEQLAAAEPRHGDDPGGVA